MQTPVRILVVDDERDLRDLLAYNLERKGHQVETAPDGLAALECARLRPPDLVILDQMMPRMSGAETLERLRREPLLAHIPVLILTAKDTADDEIAALTIGADDYIAKPAPYAVILARVAALLRRSERPGQPQSVIDIGPLSIHLDARRVFLRDEEIWLTATEHRILTALARNAGRTLGRERLVEQSMGANVRVTSRTIDVHIASVRRKLRDAGGLIETVRGFGYRMPAADLVSTSPTGADQTA